MWSIQDPKDPWAWRNTWTGEIRNSYDDLWIVIPIIVLVTVFAMLFLIPILIHRYCPHCFPGRVWCRWFESLLFVLGQISREKEEKRIERKRPTRAHPRAHSAPNFHDHVEYGVPHSIPIKTESPPQYQRFADSSSEGSIKSIRLEEDFGDDVSILDGDAEKNWRITIFKFALGLIFIGACTAAIIYSINKSEMVKTSKHTENHTLGFLPVDLNQMGNGTLSVYIRDRMNDTIKPTFSVPIRWIQEADNKRLMYRVGEAGHPNAYTLYAEADVGYNETATGCAKVAGLTYDSFMDQLGFRFVQLRWSEQVKNSASEEYEDVFVYEGEPNPTALYYGEKPGLIRAYTPTSQNFVMGFELFFLSKSSLFKVEHWIPHMTHNTESVLDFIPNSCSTN
ncbi:unnamed protein product, partial [Mesorhabditis belari]|uniref:Uncharacterized protein n=1 Tax=Mesorhabditis belari TaxID=2138241 RepID=A0AAF3EYD5_9BILA